MNKTSVYNPQEFWERRLEKNFNFKGVGYANLGEEYNKWLYRAKERVLDEVLKKNNISCEGKNVLELGVGSGFYIDYWKKKNISGFTGVDITEKSAKELSNKYPQYKFIQADISSTNFSIDNKFDIITVFDVMFHVLDEEKFEQIISNIKRLSHEKSIILITDGYLKDSYQESFHVKIRSLNRYIEILTKNKMEKRDVRPLFYFMSKPLDNNNKLLYILCLLFWIFISSIVVLFNNLGKYGKLINHLIGYCLYNIDKIILKCGNNSLCTKLMFISRSDSKL